MEHLEAEISALEDILVDPEAYADAYKENFGDEIFVKLHSQMIQYIKKNPSFRKLLKKELGFEDSSQVKACTKSLATIRSPAMFTPRQSMHIRRSARPILDE